MSSSPINKDMLVSQIADAAFADLSHAYDRLSSQSETPVAALAIFTDESGAPIFIMAEFSESGFSREESTYYSASNLDRSDHGRPYLCDEVMESVRNLEQFSYQERSRLIIAGLSAAVRRFSDSGRFSNTLRPNERLLMLWVHDTAEFVDEVTSTVRYCNSTDVADWFSANYCYNH